MNTQQHRRIERLRADLFTLTKEEAKELLIRLHDPRETCGLWQYVNERIEGAYETGFALGNDYGLTGVKL